MTNYDRTGVRSQAYSVWHYPKRTGRFMSAREADRLGMVDIDACEYCRKCSMPLALIETQVSLNPPKDARVTLQLAELAGLPCYSISVEIAADGEDIAGFKVRRLRPASDTVLTWTPAEYARFLLRLHEDHTCTSAEYPWKTPMTAAEQKRYDAMPAAEADAEASCPCQRCTRVRVASWDSPRHAAEGLR